MLDGDHYWNLAIRMEPGYKVGDLCQVSTLCIEDEEVREVLRIHLIREKTPYDFEWHFEGDRLVIEY